MKIYIGADHNGFALKEHLKYFLHQKGIGSIDVGNYVHDQDDDYTDFAHLLAQKVSHDPENTCGILICGSGIGVCITANKHQGIRAAQVYNIDLAQKSRLDDDANVLCLSSDYSTYPEAEQIVWMWLQTEFSMEDRHYRRISKIEF